ncbi:MAG: DUF4166 domain-containing protein [Blastocatellia bacterium]|nr:DUF4166 domain-containing protein [Blastocatellia bacterium]
MILLPFQAALGASIEKAAPAVKDHFLQSSGTRRFRGVMRRVWRIGGWRGLMAWPFLKVGQWTGNLFADTGTDIRFELENRVTALPDGRASMTWDRAFYFPKGTRRFNAVMVFDTEREVIVDRLGKSGHLEVELYPQIREGALWIQSGKQRLRIGPLRIPLPRWFTGRASVREWQEADGSLEVSVMVHNPLLGDFFGYEGTFTEIVQPENECIYCL